MSEEAGNLRGQPWSHEEVAAIVADYFDMLKADLTGR